VSWVLGEPGQKSTCIEICKKISTQPSPNSWWAGLARGFQPILIALLLLIYLMCWLVHWWFWWDIVLLYMWTLGSFLFSFGVFGTSFWLFLGLAW